MLSDHKEPVNIGFIYHKYIQYLYFDNKPVLGNRFIKAVMANGTELRIAYFTEEDLKDCSHIERYDYVHELLATVNDHIQPYHILLAEVPSGKWTHKEWTLWARMTR